MDQIKQGEFLDNETEKQKVVIVGSGIGKRNITAVAIHSMLLAMEQPIVLVHRPMGRGPSEMSDDNNKLDMSAILNDKFYEPRLIPDLTQMDYGGFHGGFHRTGTPNRQILEAEQIDPKQVSNSRLIEFHFQNGFSTFARNQKNADRKYNNYLKTLKSK